jgi:hypothetical protein
MNPFVRVHTSTYTTLDGSYDVDVVDPVYVQSSSTVDEVDRGFYLALSDMQMERRDRGGRFFF